MNRLKELRQKMNKTQKEVANYLSISSQAYGHYENEDREPDNATLKKLSDYFGVSTDYILNHSPATTEVKLEGVYLRLAKEAQEMGLTPEDVEKILRIYKEFKK